LEYSEKDGDALPEDISEHIKKDFQPISSVLLDFYDQADEFSKRSDVLYGVPTGFIDLDKLTNGLQPSSFVLVASRSSQSKTGFLLSLAKNAALNYKKNVAFFSSLGMSNLRMAHLLVAQETGIDPQRLSIGKLTEMEWPLFTYALERMADTKIFFNDTPALTFDHLNEQVRRLKLEFELDLIIVDNLQFMAGENINNNQSKDENYINLKILAHELDIPVLAGIQLSKRSGKRRADKRPYLSDLDEFSSLEDSVDVVMFIHHRDQYDEFDVRMKTSVAEIIVAKHNHGPVGAIELLYRKDLSKFENAATVHLDLEE
jgi:replicative DNA helicase